MKLAGIILYIVVRWVKKAQDPTLRHNASEEQYGPYKKYSSMKFCKLYSPLGKKRKYGGGGCPFKFDRFHLQGRQNMCYQCFGPGVLGWPHEHIRQMGRTGLGGAGRYTLQAKYWRHRGGK